MKKIVNHIKQSTPWSLYLGGLIVIIAFANVMLHMHMADIENQNEIIIEQNNITMQQNDRILSILSISK